VSVVLSNRFEKHQFSYRLLGYIKTKIYFFINHVKQPIWKNIYFYIDCLRQSTIVLMLIDWKWSVARRGGRTIKSKCRARAGAVGQKSKPGTTATGFHSTTARVFPFSTAPRHLSFHSPRHHGHLSLTRQATINISYLISLSRIGTTATYGTMPPRERELLHGITAAWLLKAPRWHGPTTALLLNAVAT
jgi:hypothetical protein